MNAETPKRSNPPIYRDPFAKGDDPRRNRAGRTGSRAKLGKRFFEDMYAAWEEQGEAVIARAMFHDPVAVLGVVARLMPQKIEVSTPTDGMSDERLAEMLELAERMASLKATGAMAHSINVIEHGQGVAPLLSNHEYQEAAEAAKRPGGGAESVGASSDGKDRIHTTADDPGSTLSEHNMLDVANPPYPVGKPFPTPGHKQERENIAKLAPGAENDIDPASLF